MEDNFKEVSQTTKVLPVPMSNKDIDKIKYLLDNFEKIFNLIEDAPSKNKNITIDLSLDYSNFKTTISLFLK